eukprot:sb/3479186/
MQLRRVLIKILLPFCFSNTVSLSISFSLYSCRPSGQFSCGTGCLTRVTWSEEELIKTDSTSRALQWVSRTTKKIYRGYRDGEIGHFRVFLAPASI